MIKNEKRMRQWVHFYRKNPHRFVKDYFGVKLKFFQKIIFVLMHKYPNFAFLACRGISKTFTVGLYAITIATLYPGSKIVMTSGTKGQAKKIITEKIRDEFSNNFPNIANEIKQIKEGDEPRVMFHNGSSIIAIAPNENARSLRATMLIYDESVMIKKEVIDKVFEPMKVSASRMVDMQSKALNGDYVEDLPLKTIYMTSGKLKSNWNWARFLKMYKEMINGFKNNEVTTSAVMSLPYHIALMYRLTTFDQIKKAKRDSDPVDFLMEYEGEFFGESGDAFFKMAMFEKNRLNMKPYQLKYELEDNVHGEDAYKKYLFNEEKKMPLVNGEVRLMSVDTAPSLGDGSDNNIITLARLIPKVGFYEKRIVNIKKMNNDVSSNLALYIKRWFYGFQTTQCALDVQGTSMAVFEELVKPIYDAELNFEYPAWRVIEGNATESKLMEHASRTRDLNPDDVLYAVNADAPFNHMIATQFRSALKEGDRVRFLLDRENGRDALVDMYKTLDPMQEAELLEPYIGTDATITEAVLLEGERTERGLIKLKTSSASSKKDRYVALAYLHHLATLYDKDMENIDYDAEFFSKCN